MGIAQYFYDFYLNGSGLSGAVLNHLVAALLLSVLYAPKVRGRLDVLRAGVSYAVCWAIVVLWSSVFYWLFPSSDYGYLITPVLIVLTLMLIFHRSSLVDRVLRSCMYISVTTLLTAVIFPVNLWEHATFSWDSFSLFDKLLRLAIALPLFVSLRRNSLEKMEDISPYFPTLMVAISLIGYLVNAASILVLRIPLLDSPFSFNFFSSLGLLIVEFLSYFMFYRAMADYNERRRLSLERQRMQSELELLRSYERSYDRVRMVRHDIQNQYAYVGAMLESGDYQKAVDYFRGMNYLVEGLRQTAYCQHKIINLVLSMANEKAAAEKVRLDINVSVPAQLEISDVALTSILTNLLDNGIEAVKGLEDPQRLVKAVIVMHNSYLLIRVSNPVQPGSVQIQGGILSTTKRNRAEHGYGTQIVRKCAEENGGCVEYRLEGESFLADVMLRNGAEGSEASR